MKRTVPLIITGVAGLILFVSAFVPVMVKLGEDVAVWFDLLAGIAFILGGGNLLKVHLKKVSDQTAGWGYSAVTIVAFLGTLYVGLFKLGVTPQPEPEKYGESLVDYPLSEMPAFTVEGEIPARPDEEPLPASAVRNLSEADGQITFRGWMSGQQQSELQDYDQHRAWREAVTKLFEASQPTLLKDRIAYYTEHESLSFLGYMTETDYEQLRQLLGDSPVAVAAADRLTTAAQRGTTIRVPMPPAGVVEALDPSAAFAGAEPPAAAGERRTPVSEYMFLGPKLTDLTVYGPLTKADRNNLANVWPKWESVRPIGGDTAEHSVELKKELAAAFISELEAHGTKPTVLNDDQKKAVNDHFATINDVQLLINAIRSAGEADDVELTAGDESLLRFLASSPEFPVDELATLQGFTPGMTAAAREFLSSQPTQAFFKQQLAFVILKEGPLSDEQREFLFADYREEFQWKQTVEKLFLDSHVTLYPWSGVHEQEGSYFYWCIVYLYRPLTSTVFAMLAFYVASAAFRAFRAKNIEALLLLGTAFIILLGRTFVGVWLTGWIPQELSAFKMDELTVYVMQIFNVAGNRAIMIGIALGIASTSLKVLLGIDRSYLGSGDD